mgnify:CR=1 FL=1
MSPKLQDELKAIKEPVFQPGKLAVGLVFSTFLLLVFWSWSFLELSLSEVGLGFSRTGSFLARLWPGEYSNSETLLSLGFETFVMATVGTTLGLILGLGFAFLAANNTGFSKWISAVARFVIVFFRSIPDLVLAVVLVALVGIGPAAGALALGLGSIGMVGRVSTHALEDSKINPVLALRSLGAGRSQVLVSGFIPQITPALIALFLYRLDINFRAASLMGLVGAGGIGILLKINLGTLNYQAAFAVIVFIFVTVGLLELLSINLRRLLLGNRSAAGRRFFEVWFVRLVLVAFGLILAFGTLSYGANLLTAFSRFEVFVQIATQFVSPDFFTRFDLIAEGLLETIAISSVGTFLGMFVGIPIGFLAAKNMALGKVPYFLARGFLVIKRGFPTLIIALIFVSAIGLGPMAGILAMTIGTGGALAKFIADSLEEAPMKPVQAIASNGASRFQQIAAGILPQVSPSLIGHIAYSLDMNIRYAAVLGIVGAGGIGTVVLASMKSLDYQTTSASILVLLALLVVVDRTSSFIRRKLK